MSSPPRSGVSTAAGDTAHADNLKSPSSTKSPSTSQPFIYPIRTAVGVKQSKKEDNCADSCASSASRPSSSASSGHSGYFNNVQDRRNSVSDVDRTADMAMGQMRTPGNETKDLRDLLEHLTTTRFEHLKTDEGHMILTGREGKLTKCEDEPIHMPGAVQSFGCMIVVRISTEGQIIVRQVSENSREILGLSAPYLFSLPTFLDVLEEDQADLLWNNIDSLDQATSGLTDSGPAVFQLHGYNMAQYDERVRQGQERLAWHTWCAAHIPDRRNDSDGELTVILEFEPVDDIVNHISTDTRPPSPEADSDNFQPSESRSMLAGQSFAGSEGSTPGTVPLSASAYELTEEQVRESTQPAHKPIKALSRLRRQSELKRIRSRRPGAFSSAGGIDGTANMLDMFGILSEVNEQLSEQSELKNFLKVLVGIVRDITEFSRAMIYQFDESWNGQVVSELVNMKESRELYHGLHFPAIDIPAQARALYKINKVRLLYDREQTSARLICRDRTDLDNPVDMTHSFLRAMSPIHLKYLANMGVRSSMSVSITAFGELWGLISLHNYAAYGKRVSFPVRQLLRLIGASASSNIERLSYTRRLAARKLINTLPTDKNPSGYIITNAEDLLKLFDADYGVIAIGNEAKILGPLNASQEVLAVTEYLRIKKFKHLVTSQDIRRDFPDMVLPTGLQVLAGLLLVPLTSSGVDFIAFLRKAQLRHINWAGKPFKEGLKADDVLEPRKSFKVWSQTVEGTCRSWQDEELETASVLCVVYGKFISVWRQREQALHYNQLNRLLLSNASHEVRTPLNHIINYLELALDSKLDEDTRENLSKSHLASKSLLFVINDLLDLTKQEHGNELLLQEPFDLAATVREAVEMHEWEAKRRKIDFVVKISPEVCMVLGDKNRIRQVITNTVTNSVKYTGEGRISVSMRMVPDAERQSDLPPGCDMEIELIVSDTGEGIPQEKLEVLFRQFEQVESVIAEPGRGGNNAVDLLSEESGTASPFRDQSGSGLGLGLAIVARVVRNLGGQLRVASTVGEGSTFTYYIPFCSADVTPPSETPLGDSGDSKRSGETATIRKATSIGSGSTSSAGRSEIDSLVEAMQKPVLKEQAIVEDVTQQRKIAAGTSSGPPGSKSGAVQSPQLSQNSRTMSFEGASHHVEGSIVPIRSVKVEPQGLDTDHRQGQTVMKTGTKSAAESFKEDVQKSYADAKHDTATIPSRVREPLSKTPVGSSDPMSLQVPLDSLTKKEDSSSASSERRLSSSSTAAQRRMAKIRGLHQSSNNHKSDISPLRVLVVEDDPINRTILKKRLGLDGHTTLLAVNGEEGVREFEKEAKKIDVILMDLQMPICNGQDACVRIRELEEARAKSGEHADRPAAQVLNGRVPILAVSATLVPEMRKEMTKIGMDGWLLKPIDFGRLGALLKGLLRPEDREANCWEPGYSWERGGWLSQPVPRSIPAAASNSVSASTEAEEE